ncbi:hypothetical protein ACQY0O_000134 [Thecaphora frezii]
MLEKRMKQGADFIRNLRKFGRKYRLNFRPVIKLVRLDLSLIEHQKRTLKPLLGIKGTLTKLEEITSEARKKQMDIAAVYQRGLKGKAPKKQDKARPARHRGAKQEVSPNADVPGRSRGAEATRSPTGESSDEQRTLSNPSTQHAPFDDPVLAAIRTKPAQTSSPDSHEIFQTPKSYFESDETLHSERSPLAVSRPKRETLRALMHGDARNSRPSDPSHSFTHYQSSSPVLSDTSPKSPLRVAAPPATPMSSPLRGAPGTSELPPTPNAADSLRQGSIAPPATPMSSPLRGAPGTSELPPTPNAADSLRQGSIAPPATPMSSPLRGAPGTSDLPPTPNAADSLRQGSIAPPATPMSSPLRGAPGTSDLPPTPNAAGSLRQGSIATPATPMSSSLRGAPGTSELPPLPKTAGSLRQGSIATPATPMSSSLRGAPGTSELPPLPKTAVPMSKNPLWISAPADDSSYKRIDGDLPLVGEKVSRQSADYGAAIRGDGSSEPTKPARKSGKFQFNNIFKFGKSKTSPNLSHQGTPTDAIASGRSSTSSSSHSSIKDWLMAKGFAAGRSRSTRDPDTSSKGWSTTNAFSAPRWSSATLGHDTSAQDLSTKSWPYPRSSSNSNRGGSAAAQS